VWYFFVETRGYTLEQVSTIFETPGLSWKQRRNMQAPSASTTFEDGSSTGSVIGGNHNVVSKGNPGNVVTEKEIFNGHK
jgi:hypothetical protein